MDLNIIEKKEDLKVVFFCLAVKPVWRFLNAMGMSQ